MFDPSREGRGLLFAAWLVVQVALIATAGRRPAAMGGFRMFPETSTLRYELYRVVDGRTVPVPDGEWNAKDSMGTLRHFSWKDRVRRRELCSFGVEIVASYGVDTQTARLRAALDDVLEAATDDTETEKLVMRVTTRKNGHDPETFTLETAPRHVR